VRIKKRSALDTATINNTNFPILEGKGALLANDGNTIPVAFAPTGFDSSFLGYDGTSPTPNGTFTDSTDLPSFAAVSGTRWEGTVQTSADSVPEFAAPVNLDAYRSKEVSETGTHRYDAATKQWVPETGAAATHLPGQYLVKASDPAQGFVVENNKILVNGNDETNNLYNSAGTKISVVSEVTTFFDAREYDASADAATNGVVKLTEIDIAKLNSARIGSSTGSALFPTAGTNGTILYAYRTDSTPTTPNGIRLINGSTLNNKMTMVTQNPLYIKGNFNNVAKKGVAVMSDSTNLLSNEWNDSMKSKANSSTLVNIPSTDLEVNAAIVTGNYETIAPDPSTGTAAKYNGGFENLPRFHENWGGTSKRVYIKGAFINLQESQYGKGNWGKGGVYSAPKRSWDFDSFFLDPANLPPGYPISVASQRVVWWKERNLTFWP